MALLISVALIPAVIGIVSFLIETDREAIERIVEDSRRAVLSGDAGRILRHLADGATVGGRIGQGLLAPVASRHVDQERRRFSGLTVRCRKIVVEGDEARGEWLVTAAPRHDGGEQWPAFTALVAVRFVRGPDGFLVRHAEVSAP
jgi:hypothetical protein